ncbi:5-formyltetrahydrofolate cyclo-ligase [Pedobacter sandarakinus]|uniref:5-formyltetrahydrofolate cyclo-ligase n=1 Tax=Pedobacter sandarakinus TaxID=353156 RepID=UPI002246C135|nr:5-formyltetrahydrofolate cyclo-ligase [Pedobacter sandarakinus]MCX2573770.1 5-formyltetrahydrofolate cyclo-ligase [Pedobacter sandarakinus]
MLKADARKHALKQRLQINNVEYASLNNELLHQFSTLDFNNIYAIHTFLPIIEKKEPNTFLLINWLHINYPNIKIILPKADFKTSSITNHEYFGVEALQESGYGILEPQTDQIYHGEVNLVLVPLLAFDRRGYRVGYGKGFYDRFLGNLNAKKIGLSLLQAIDSIDDVDQHDIKLNCCITPTQIIKF